MCWMSECSFDLIPQNRHGGTHLKMGYGYMPPPFTTPFSCFFSFISPLFGAVSIPQAPISKFFWNFQCFKIKSKISSNFSSKSLKLDPKKKKKQFSTTNIWSSLFWTKLLFSALRVAHSYQNEMTNTSWQAIIKVDSSHDWFITRTGPHFRRYQPFVRLAVSWIWN